MFNTLKSKLTGNKAKAIFLTVTVTLTMTLVLMGGTMVDAITWKGQLKHARTVSLRTSWNNKLNSIDTGETKKLLWVDTARQRLTLFEDKKFVVSYQITTGKNATPTPTGTFKLNYTSNHANDGLSLRNANGGVTAKVTYWMPFVDDMIAFHNASWRQSWEFGKITHSKTNGSNGCVNMSYSDIADMYSRVEKGTVVHVTK